MVGPGLLGGPGEHSSPEPLHIAVLWVSWVSNDHTTQRSDS